MQHTFLISILAADCVFYKGECLSLIVPTIEGQYGILAHHSDMIAAIVPGTMTYKLPECEDRFAAVSSGLIKVEKNEVLVLVDSIVRPEDIDAHRAKRDIDAAREEMLQKKSMLEYRSAQAQLARALSRLKTKSTYDKK